MFDQRCFGNFLFGADIFILEGFVGLAKPILDEKLSEEGSCEVFDWVVFKHITEIIQRNKNIAQTQSRLENFCRDQTYLFNFLIDGDKGYRKRIDRPKATCQRWFPQSPLLSAGYHQWSSFQYKLIIHYRLSFLSGFSSSRTSLS